MSVTNIWWARQWESLRQELGIAADSGRGASARVKRLEVLPGVISAVMQEKDVGARTIEVRVAPLLPDQWERVVEQLSKLAMVNAQILSGSMPPELEQVFVEAGARLLPGRDEIALSCSGCSPGTCRHLPQVFSLFAEMLNDDPGLLFTLRGRDRQQVLRQVREVRAAPSAAAPNGSAAPGETPEDKRGVGTHLAGGQPPNAAEVGSTGEAGLAAQMDQYWGNRKLLKQFHHHIAPPQVELSLLRRLGPINTSADAMLVYEQMVALYRRITDDALALAYAVDDETPPTSAGPPGGPGEGAAPR